MDLPPSYRDESAAADAPEPPPPLAQAVPPPPPPVVPAVTDLDWTPLDPAIKKIWFFRAGTLPALLLAVCVALFVNALRVTGLGLFAIAAAVGAVLALLLLAIYPAWYARRRFAVNAVRIDRGVFEHRDGIFWRRDVAIPVNRLQHVDLQSGPLDRALGIATLRLFTAGTRGAVHGLTGLSEARARQFRDVLIEAGGLRGKR